MGEPDDKSAGQPPTIVACLASVVGGGQSLVTTTGVPTLTQP
jgi:hypothetical protein